MAYNCTGHITIKHKDNKMPEILNVYTRLFDQIDIKEAHNTFYDRLVQMTSSLQSPMSLAQLTSKNDVTFTVTKIEENI
tara:strand:+ start:219 stop:455 length:237 start_codon:yes stop_codon:yes gene_type:complete